MLPMKGETARSRSLLQASAAAECYQATGGAHWQPFTLPLPLSAAARFQLFYWSLRHACMRVAGSAIVSVDAPSSCHLPIVTCNSDVQYECPPMSLLLTCCWHLSSLPR